MCIRDSDESLQARVPLGEDVPYRKNDAPKGTEHTLLEKESKKLYRFFRGGDDALKPLKIESMFIQLLEGLHPEEAKIICLVKDKNLTEKYKLTREIISAAFPDIAWGLHRGT